MKNIYKVPDNGWNDGVTFVEVNTERITRGDFYLYINKKGKPTSIELCDSDDLAKYVSKLPKEYKKITKASQEISKGFMEITNRNVTIDKSLTI